MDCLSQDYMEPTIFWLFLYPLDELLDIDFLEYYWSWSWLKFVEKQVGWGSVLYNETSCTYVEFLAVN